MVNKWMIGLGICSPRGEVCNGKMREFLSLSLEIK